MTNAPSGWAIGWTTFTAFMMFLVGFWQAMAGLIALVNDDFYVVGQEYVFQFDTTTWGWIHLLLGVVLFLAGAALFSGAVWARTVGVFGALITGIAAFAWLPYYPIWGIMIATAAVFVIWALTSHGRDIESA
jgi:hypothetical protein